MAASAGAAAGEVEGAIPLFEARPDSDVPNGIWRQPPAVPPPNSILRALREFIDCSPSPRGNFAGLSAGNVLTLGDVLGDGVARSGLLCR